MKPHPIPNPNLLTNHIPSYSMTAWHENGTEKGLNLEWKIVHWTSALTFKAIFARKSNVSSSI
jgi:hypothetical protein